MRFTRSLPFVLSLFTAALADVEFTTPTVDTVLKAGDVVTVHWKDSGIPPRISELTQYDLYLCAGEDLTGLNVSFFRPIARCCGWFGLLTNGTRKRSPFS